MTIDTQKLAADIARVMELDAKRTQGEWEAIDAHGKTACIARIAPELEEYQRELIWENYGQARCLKEDADFIAAAPLMADIIRQQGKLIKKLVEALDDGCLWVREMREGVNKWAGSIDMCGVQARQENLDSWANKTRELLTLAAPLVKKAGE